MALKYFSLGAPVWISSSTCTNELDLDSGLGQNTAESFTSSTCESIKYQDTKTKNLYVISRFMKTPTSKTKRYLSATLGTSPQRGSRATTTASRSRWAFKEIYLLVQFSRANILVSFLNCYMVMPRARNALLPWRCRSLSFIEYNGTYTWPEYSMNFSDAVAFGRMTCRSGKLYISRNQWPTIYCCQKQWHFFSTDIYDLFDRHSWTVCCLNTCMGLV